MSEPFDVCDALVNEFLRALSMVCSLRYCRSSYSPLLQQENNANIHADIVELMRNANIRADIVESMRNVVELVADISDAVMKIDEMFEDAFKDLLGHVNREETPSMTE